MEVVVGVEVGVVVEVEVVVVVEVVVEVEVVVVMPFDTLEENIGVAKRKVATLQGRIKHRASLPQTEGIQNQLMIMKANLVAEELMLEKLEHRLEKRDAER